MLVCAVFGVPLGDIVVREERSSGVPFIIELMGEYISNPPCVTEEGLFRVPGKATERDGLIELLDKGGPPVKSLDLTRYNLMSICDVFKSYFRMLPEPLLGYDLYNPLLAVARTYSSCIAAPSLRSLHTLTDLLSR